MKKSHPTKKEKMHNQRQKAGKKSKSNKVSRLDVMKRYLHLKPVSFRKQEELESKVDRLFPESGYFDSRNFGIAFLVVLGVCGILVAGIAFNDMMQGGKSSVGSAIGSGMGTQTGTDKLVQIAFENGYYDYLYVRNNNGNIEYSLSIGKFTGEDKVDWTTDKEKLIQAIDQSDHVYDEDKTIMKNIINSKNDYDLVNKISSYSNTEKVSLSGAQATDPNTISQPLFSKSYADLKTAATTPAPAATPAPGTPAATPAPAAGTKSPAVVTYSTLESNLGQNWDCSGTVCHLSAVTSPQSAGHDLLPQIGAKKYDLQSTQVDSTLASLDKSKVYVVGYGQEPFD